MADDQSRRPNRASDPPPARGSGKTSASDPLAELARLIGQTDPFGEYGREAARRSPPLQSVARADWNQPLGKSYTAQYGSDARGSEPAPRYAEDSYPASPSAPASPLIPQDYGSQNYERQPYEARPLAGGTDHYEADQGSRQFPLGQTDYQQDFYDQAPVEDEYYEDALPSRRRMVVMAIAGVAALAVVGTAGAFGYRALVGSGSTKPPPVIKADTAPSKIVPATTGKDTQSNKLITDRVNERGQGEKLVSREEQPMDRPTAVALSQSGPQTALGSGVVGSEPKKVRTIAIHPDQPVVGDAAPSSMSAGTAPARPAPAPRAAAAPPRPAPDKTADAEESAPAAPTQLAPQPRQAAPASGNAPVSLNPNAAPSRAAPAQAPAAPARTASVAPQASAPASTGGAGSYVQVSSQRSEGEAQAAFRSLQGKFPDQLGGRQPYIHKVDLGAKGTYYRAMVGPFANAGEASELCSSLKAAGGQCLVQRN